MQWNYTYRVLESQVETVNFSVLKRVEVHVNCMRNWICRRLLRIFIGSRYVRLNELTGIAFQVAGHRWMAKMEPLCVFDRIRRFEELPHPACDQQYYNVHLPVILPSQNYVLWNGWLYSVFGDSPRQRQLTSNLAERLLSKGETRSTSLPSVVGRICARW